MRLFFSMITACLLLISVQTFSNETWKPQPRVLVFSKTAAFRHKSSIAVGKIALMKLGVENGFSVDTTENVAYISADSLKHYSAVVFLSTTGDVLDYIQQASLERYVQAGGGFVGIHAASDCEYNWPWYGQLVGAYFKSHPSQQMAKIVVKDASHISTKHLPAVWERFDEWYNWRIVPSEKDVKILLSIDEKSYNGGENGVNHPMAWYHDFDGGRSFYTELGHVDASFTEENFLKHILGGIQYAIGDNKPLDFSKCHSQMPTEENRLNKTSLVKGVFDEPLEMAILPNLDILVVQRKGEVMYYNSQKKTIEEVAKIKTYNKANAPGVNAEEGLLGITADPDFAKNNFVYMFYAAPDTTTNRLSRFVFKNGKLDLSSEKQILQFYSQRNICCHTGGSLTFGKNRELYISAGDNSTPFDQPNSTYKLNGYGPMDNREGLEQYDARRSSSNTNDLRGKISRIRVNLDGTYSIPEGNLFPVGTPKTRPEIYVMGNRNPYRISVDKKNGFLYWGEVGPDAGIDSLERRGPRGYDELNQARKAGYFGWPLFVGNNYPYHRFDYATGESGPAFDPLHPMNESKNNTGLLELPPVSPAFIWYPYAVSPDFPELGTGGRNAMAGPIYYPEFYPKATRMPDYYAGKMFFYEWIRGWVKALTLKPNGDLEKMEPFMPNTKWNSLMDLEMGPDGKMYALEYGSGWFNKNADAALSRIDYYSGNRPPLAMISVDKTSGSIPFTVTANAEGSKDADNDALTYIWHFGKVIKQTTTPKVSFKFPAAGDYDIYVEVKDSKGAIAKSEMKSVYAGNEVPVVKIDVDENSEFYTPGKPVNYKVTVKDKEDGTVIDPANLLVKVSYVKSSDKAQVVGHQIVSAPAEGKVLIQSLDCKTCHKADEKSIGPSYSMIAEKYAKDSRAVDYLSNKIIKGGGGVWGEVAMSAHPDLKPQDAVKIVNYILTLKPDATKSLPAIGSITATDKEAKGGRLMQITATYTDKGGKNAKPLTGGDVLALKLKQ